MNCGHVCARIFGGVAILVAVWCMLLIFYCLDEDMQKYKWSKWWSVGTVIGLLGTIGFYTKEQQRFGIRLGIFIITIYLVVSTTMDILLKMVTDVVHYLGLAGGIILILQAPTHPEVCKELITYTIIQYIVFGRLYGRADVVGFVLCAFFAMSMGRGIEAYVSHMIIAFGLLALVQVFRQNIAINGNLKHPVALFPYIMCGFFLII